MYQLIFHTWNINQYILNTQEIQLKKAHIVVDLGFGDAGKGTIVDLLCRTHPVHTVFRYCGGPQAAHNVVTPDGRHHTFSQFGSGTFIPGVHTHLGQHMLIHPLGILNEGEALKGKGVDHPFQRLTINEQCLVITPFQQWANQLRELSRGNDRHGSCGIGVGETAADYEVLNDDSIFAKDLGNPDELRRKLIIIRQHKIEQLRDIMDGLINNRAARETIDLLCKADIIEEIISNFCEVDNLVRIVDAEYEAELINRDGHIVFEGSQGVLLDEWFGFFPYVTRSTTTTTYAQEMLTDAAYKGVTTKIGVIRAYQTRHGAGPFVSENKQLTQQLQEDHNRDDHPWQKSFRCGWLDIVATKYAIAVTGGIDQLAVTCLDRLKDIEEWYACNKYLSSSGRIYGRLPVPKIPTLDGQRNITQVLMNTHPLLTVVTCRESLSTRRNVFARMVEEYIAYLQKELRTKVTITSNGPSATHKRILTGNTTFGAAMPMQ